MSGLPFSPQRLKLYNWHKWAGITILALSALRLAWRLTHRPPALPRQVLQAMPGWQLKAYHATHHLMYALFFAVPLAGWAYSSMTGFPVVLFGVLPLPDFVAVDKEFAKLFKPVHAILAYTLLALVACTWRRRSSTTSSTATDCCCACVRGAPDFTHPTPPGPSSTPRGPHENALHHARQPGLGRAAGAGRPGRGPGSRREADARQRDRLRQQADGRAGLRQVHEVRRPDRLRPEEARGRQVGFTIDIGSATIGDPETDRELPRRRGSTRPSSRRPASSPAASRRWAAASSRSPASWRSRATARTSSCPSP